MIGFWIDKNNDELIQENGLNQEVFYGDEVAVRLFVDELADGEEISIKIIAKQAGKKVDLPIKIKEAQQIVKVKNKEVVSAPFFIDPNWHNEIFEYYDYNKKKVLVDFDKILSFEFEAKHIKSNTTFSNLPKESIFKLKPKIYKRNYEELLGLFHKNKSTKKDRDKNFENHFISKDKGIKKIVDSFLKDIYKEKKSIKNIEKIVLLNAKQLWKEASETAQKGKLDDRPLYWARIKMQTWLKRHPLFSQQFDVETSIVKKNSPLHKIIDLFEQKSRNYTDIDFAKAHKSAKKILITGFDPFILNGFDHPQLKGNIFQSNPSGSVALALNNEKINSKKNIAFIQSMLVPVRYSDFDGCEHNSVGKGIGIIEKYIGPWINKVDMILTISQSGPGDYYIDKFATARRGGFVDNKNYTRKPNSFSIETANEWLETTLPEAMTKPKNIEFNWSFNQKENSEKRSPKSNDKLESGSGGNYLSNEIFYRVAKLRHEMRPELPTGHFHISMLQSQSQDYSNRKTKKLLRIVKKGIEKGIEAL